MATEADHQMNVTRNLQDISPTFLSPKYAKRYQKYKNKEKILSSYEADLFVSSLPVQLDNVDQYYYYYEDDVIKKAIPKKFPLKSTSLQNSHIQSKSTFPFSTYCGCCCCCCDCCHTPTQNNNNNSNINSHNDNDIDDGYSSTIKKCFSSTKFQHILHHVILILLAISTALSILLLLLGIFLNCRACLTTGCILGIASFGALLHGCLRHRSLPNSSMPIMLSASCIIYPPIGDHLSLTPNRFLRKHSSPEYFQQLQQQQQQKYRGHQYRLKTIDNPQSYYYYHCNNNSKSKSNNSCHCTKNPTVLNNNNKNCFNRSNGINQAQTEINEVSGNQFKKVEDTESSNNSSLSSSPSSTASTESAMSTISASVTTVTIQSVKHHGDNNNNDTYKSTNEHNSKSVNSGGCKQCPVSSYPKQNKKVNTLQNCMKYQTQESCRNAEWSSDKDNCTKEDHEQLSEDEIEVNGRKEEEENVGEEPEEMSKFHYRNKHYVV